MKSFLKFAPILASIVFSHCNLPKEIRRSSEPGYQIISYDSLLIFYHNYSQGFKPNKGFLSYGMIFDVSKILSFKEIFSNNIILDFSKEIKEKDLYMEILVLSEDDHPSPAMDVIEYNLNDCYFPYCGEQAEFHYVILQNIIVKKNGLCYFKQRDEFRSGRRKIEFKRVTKCGYFGPFLLALMWPDTLYRGIIVSSILYIYYFNSTEFENAVKLTLTEYKTHLMEVIRKAKEKNLFKKCE